MGGKGSTKTEGETRLKNKYSMKWLTLLSIIFSTFSHSLGISKPFILINWNF